MERRLRRLLPSATVRPGRIHEAMRYSVMAGGKRLRPILVIAAAECCGGKAGAVIDAACALEMIHTYSLVHDDLPAMDDDDLRRGRPTSHKVFGEDMAILAGDALLTEAFRILSRPARNGGAARALEAIHDVAIAAGSRGMIGGQVADILADSGRWKTRRGKDFASPRALLDYIHKSKTAALITGSLRAGARLAGASPAKMRALVRYGTALGLAFQIRDDVLDRVGDKAKLGKRGSDIANRKLTYPVLFGVPASQRRAAAQDRAAHAALRPFGRRAGILHDLADFVLSRDR